MSKFNWQEPSAYTTAIAATAIGIYLGHVCEAAWLSRAGSVVVVIGVLLVTSRKNEILQKKATDFISVHRDTQFKNVLDEFENQDGTPIAEDRAAKLKEQIYSEMNSMVEEIYQERARVFKMHEVAIVIVGTLLNGFGEWLMKLAQ